MEIAYAVAAVASALAGVLAWGAKLWWGREYAAAKDETIRAKDAQIALLEREIQGLRELTPMRIREYFISVKQQLEEYNDHLQEQLRTARVEIGSKDQQIDRLNQDGTKQTAEIVRLEREREEIKTAADNLEGQLQELRATYESKDVIMFRIPKLDPKLFVNLQESTKSLQSLVFHTAIDTSRFQLPKDFLQNYGLLSQGLHLEPDVLPTPQGEKTSTDDTSSAGDSES